MFGGVLSLFGVSRSKFQSVSLGEGLPDTTIHGMFAAGLSDFGGLGALLLFCLIGFVSGVSYTLLRKGYFSAIIFLFAPYFFTFGMPVNSVIKFNNVNASIFCMTIILIFISSRRRYA
tara:strand:- start:1222 stop:1575 length:354 start_codon:yes stop_codon:yes gene_type:complete